MGHERGHPRDKRMQSAFVAQQMHEHGANYGNRVQRTGKREVGGTDIWILDRAAGLDSAAKRKLVGILQVATHGQAARQTRHLDTQRLDGAS